MITNLTTVLNAFKCSVTESPYFILRLYSFFRRNSLFTRDLDWYKVPNLSHRAFAIASPDTFNNTEFETHNRIVLFAFRSNFFHSSSVTPVGLVPGSTAIH